MYGKWPPTPSKQFINIAVILKEKVSRNSADEFTKATIRGNPDDFFQTKQKIDFDQLARTKDGEPAQLVLVEGVPGIGKSTFAWEACRRWGAGEILQQYKLMVLLRLRERRVQQAQSVADLFYFKCDDHIKQNAIQEIESNHGAGVLLILEGFDELPALLRKQDSLFMDIIKGETLWNATIMMTSRHWASRPLLENDELHRPLSQHIEIVGFTKKDIDDYLQCMTFDDPSVFPGINEYLSCYPHIATMMYVPINCAIVLEVYRVNRSNENQLIPKTMTQLYSSLVRTLLLRYLLDHPDYKDKYVKLESFQDLPDSVYEQFCKIAKIAYEGICNDDQIIFSDLPSGFETLGLMHCVPELYVDQGAVVSYNFLHLTLQEFMAAVYVSLMTPDKQIKHFFSVGISTMVLVFTAGLTKFNYKEKELEKFICFIDHDYLESISFFHWLFEAQKAKLLQTLCKSTISFSGIGSRGPFDYYVLGYCVVQSNCKWDIYFPKFTNKETEMFVKGATCTNNNEETCGKIESLRVHVHFEHSTIPVSLKSMPTHLLSDLKKLTLLCANDGWSSLAPLLLRTPQLHELVLDTCYFPRGSVIQLFETLSSLNSIISLWIVSGYVSDFNKVWIHPEDCEGLSRILSASQSLTKLMVNKSRLGMNFVSKYLIDGPNKTICVQRLEIPSLKLSPEDVESLSSMLKTNHTLLNLNIGYGNIDSIGAHHITDRLKCNNTLRELNMSHNPIGNDGAIALAQMLRVNKSLSVLDLSNCSITELGVRQLANPLCANSSLKTLNLSYNTVKDEGASTLGQMLTINHTLRNLGLEMCSITEVGVNRLACALCSNSSLETIDLNCNLHGHGAIILAQMLGKTQPLKQHHLLNCSIHSMESNCAGKSLVCIQ